MNEQSASAEREVEGAHGVVSGDLLEELRWRGFLESMTDEEAALRSYLLEAPRGIYVGFDPTAASLHLGNLIPVMALAHAQRCGHRSIVLVGGGTGMIGDPSGKSSERQLLDQSATAANSEKIRAQLSRFFDLSEPSNGVMVNNADWLSPLGFIDFLRDIGKHFSVNEMMKRDSVRTRLEEREQGISYTEFTYMLLQAYDFMHLYDREGCTIQLGGSDQWGNILSGRELIRRRLGGRAEGITFPLLMTSSGKKFGKSEAGAIWLDAELTSPYQLYQYWLQSADADVIRYLKLFTFLSQEEIETLAQETKRAPEQREAQRRLAAANTEIIHGADAVRAVETVSRILFSGSKERPDRRVIDMLAAELPSATIERAALAEGVKVGALLSMTGLAKSNKAARQLLQGGGVSINNERLSVEQQQLTEIPGGWEGALLLQVGKKRHALIQVSE